MTHVRVLAGSLTPGTGSHVYHHDLIRRLAERGHCVSVLCTAGGERVRDVAEVVELPLHGYVRQGGVWRIAPWLELRHLSRLVQSQPLEAADVVIGGEHLLLPSHARRFPQTPWIYLPHALTVSQEIDSYQLPPLLKTVTRTLYRRLQKWALQCADRTLRFTRTACDVLRSEYRLAVPPRFAVNPVGIKLPTNTPNRPALLPVRVLYVGQLNPRKRVHVILEALAASPSRDWQFDIVGDGPLRRDLERLAEQLGIAGQVRFHGLQPDPTPWYERAHLLTLASRSESLGLVLLEAMSHGVPCLGLRPDGVTCWNVNEELIDHERTGLLARGDADFALQLDAAIQHPERLETLGESARREVHQRYQWEAHLDRYEALFAELQRPECGISAPGSGHAPRLLTQGGYT